STRLTKGDLFYKICHSKAATKAITLVPGETTVVFLANLASKWDLDYEKLHDIYKERAPFLEGYLIPQTYKMPLEMSEDFMVDVLLGYAKRFHKKHSMALLGSYDETVWKDYLRKASIVQKEAANIQEMPIVASVINNRLAKGMKLQMDGTLNYGKYSHQKVTPYRIRHDKSPYNTYRYKGVPPEPVCVVNLDAIKAVINPAKSDYLYFMKNKKGVHDFSRYYSTHLKNIGNVQK
ncbi:MAG: endolytic transglycosylase MltG, partial [Thiovulaceae bacterium]|nr:endolytic transglycosylase MltG [Sulfurimonadaceae bacterium]